MFRIIQSIPPIELIFTILGEKVTTEISQNEKPDTFEKNKKVAKRCGSVVGNVRKDTEKEIGRSIISENNFLGKPKKLKACVVAVRMHKPCIHGKTWFFTLFYY